MLTVCLGKSTYARCGIIVNVTPLEPEWEGHVTLEFSNTTPLPAKIYANEGIAQMLFFESDEGLRDVLQRPRRQVPGPEGRDAAQGVMAAGRHRSRATSFNCTSGRPLLYWMACTGTKPSCGACHTRLIRFEPSRWLAHTTVSNCP